MWHKISPFFLSTSYYVFLLPSSFYFLSSSFSWEVHIGCLLLCKTSDPFLKFCYLISRLLKSHFLHHQFQGSFLFKKQSYIYQCITFTWLKINRNKRCILNKILSLVPFFLIFKFCSPNTYQVQLFYSFLL